MRTRTRAKILTVVGARATLLRIAPLIAEMERQPEVHPILVHTGPYYREAMSDQFFGEMHIRQPDFDPGVESGYRATQVAEIIKRLEPVMEFPEPPSLWPRVAGHDLESIDIVLSHRGRTSTDLDPASIWRALL